MNSQLVVRHFGRKSGVNAFDQSYRDLSKKQKKRKVAAKERKLLQIKPHIEQMKAEAQLKRMKSPNMIRYIDKLNLDLGNVMEQLMSPDPSKLGLMGLIDDDDNNDNIDDQTPILDFKVSPI